MYQYPVQVNGLKQLLLRAKDTNKYHQDHIVPKIRQFKSTVMPTLQA